MPAIPPGIAFSGFTLTALLTASRFRRAQGVLFSMVVSKRVCLPVNW